MNIPPPSPHTRPYPNNNTRRMEVVGWSPSEKPQESDMFLPPQDEGWNGVEDGEPRCVLAKSSIQVPLIHNPLPPARTPVLRRSHSLNPLLLPSSLPLVTNAVSKIQSTFRVLAMHLSSIAANSPKNISPAAARSVPLTWGIGLYPKGPGRRGGTRSPRSNGTTRG